MGGLNDVDVSRLVWTPETPSTHTRTNKRNEIPSKGRVFMQGRGPVAKKKQGLHLHPIPRPFHSPPPQQIVRPSRSTRWNLLYLVTFDARQDSCSRHTCLARSIHTSISVQGCFLSASFFTCLNRSLPRQGGGNVLKSELFNREGQPAEEDGRGRAGAKTRKSSRRASAPQSSSSQALAVSANPLKRRTCRPRTIENSKSRIDLPGKGS